VCVCSLRYTACKAHALYCIVFYGLSEAIKLFHIISYAESFFNVEPDDTTQLLRQNKKKSKQKQENICTDTIKVNEQFTLEQATKAQNGSRGIAVLFL